MTTWMVFVLKELLHQKMLVLSSVLCMLCGQPHPHIVS